MRLAVRARIGTPLTASSGNPASSSTAAIAPETFITSGLPVTSGSICSMSRATATCRPAMPASSAIASSRPTRGSRLLVQRMAVARDRAARLARLDERGERRRIDVAQRDVRARMPDMKRAGGFGRAEDHGAAAEHARRDRALQRFRRRGERHARRGDAGTSPCSAIATSVASSIAALRRASAACPVTSSQTWSVKLIVADEVAGTGRGRAPRSSPRSTRKWPSCVDGLRPDLHSRAPGRPVPVSYTEKRFDFRTC